MWDGVEWIKLAVDMVQWLALTKNIWKLTEYFLIICIIEFSRTKQNSTDLCVESTAEYFISLRETNKKEGNASVRF